jgi:peptidoglycan-N-acetylglucosamine deacetylase
VHDGYGVNAFQRLGRSLAERAVGTVTDVVTGDAVAAIAFDDGPHPVVTPRLLAILHAHRARATFFMLGKAAQKYPELVHQVAAEGHAIGNHSWDHPSFLSISGRERRSQIDACRRAVSPHGNGLFRPPYGHQSVASRLDALRMRQQVVAWSVDANDWLDLSAGVIVRRVMRQIRPGSIILFHDGRHDAVRELDLDRSVMLKSVSMLLDRLGGKFTFVTVPELFRSGRPRRALWFRDR